MMVRFATTCDACGARSEEYTAWPSCEDCQEDICPACAHHLVRDADVDCSELVQCLRCHALALQDVAP